MWLNKFTWKGCCYWRYLYMNQTLSLTRNFLWSHNEIKCFVYYSRGFFFSGKYYEVANPSSGLQGWSRRGAGSGNNSALDSSVSQGKRKIHDKWMLYKWGFSKMMSFTWWHHPASSPDHFLPSQPCLESLNVPNAFGVLSFWAFRALCWCYSNHRKCFTLLLNKSLLTPLLVR